jgi:hypothetical protein
MNEQACICALVTGLALAGAPSLAPAAADQSQSRVRQLRLQQSHVVAQVSPNASQPLQPRTPGEKKTLPQLQAMPPTQQVVVKFREGLAVRLSGGQLTGLSSGQAAAFRNALSAAGVPAHAVKRMHLRSEAELDAEREKGQRMSGRQLADLNLYYTIDLPTGVNAANMAQLLNALDFVEHAEPAPMPAPPPAGTRSP